MSYTPTTAEIIQEWMRSRMMMLRVAIPARVEAYDAAKQTVDVKPLIFDVHIDGDGGEIVESIPVLPGVRVMHLRGGGFFAAVPLEKGDFVQLLVNDRCLDRWRQKGTESNPGDLRLHDLADAVAFPCGYPDTAPLTDASSSAMLVGKDGGPVIKIDATTVSLWSKTATDFVALASKVDARVGALEAAFATHAHVVATTGTATAQSGTAAPVVPPYAPGSPTGSTKVKAV